MEWEGIRFLICLGFAIASVLMVLTRRLLPVSLQNTEVIKKSCGISNRNSWNVILDIAITFIQMQRSHLCSQIMTIRKTTDVLFLPCDRSKVRIEKVVLKTPSGDILEAEWLIPLDENDTSRASLYFHGGGFCLCSINTHRQLVANIAIASKTRTLIFAYRRTPEHPYPAQIEDSLIAFNYMRSENGGSFKPTNITFIGDSAGGGLALSTAIHFRDAGEPLPGAIVMISPWVDLTNCSESWQKNVALDFLPPAHLMFEFTKLYAPSSIKFDDPRISPLYGNFNGLPPLYIQVSDSEQLFDDSVNLEKKARESNVEVTLRIFNGLPHVFQSFGGSQALSAISEIGKWIQERNAASLKVDPTISELHLQNISSHQKEKGVLKYISNELIIAN